MKRIISLLLSVVLIVGLITTDYRNASASDVDNTVSTTSIDMGYIVDQDFEDEAKYIGKWRNQSESEGKIEYIVDPDDSNNHVLKCTRTGNEVTFDFNNGDQQIFKTGKSYIVTYRYKSEVSFHAYYDGINDNWTTYDPWVSSTDKWTTKTVEITPTDKLSSFQIGFQLQNQGSFYLDDFRIIEKGREVKSVDIDFEYVDVDNSWYLISDNRSELTGEYYATTALVDGREQTIIIDATKTSLVVWPNFFCLVERDRTYPIESLEIKKDSLLYEVEANQWSEQKQGGQVLKFSNELLVQKNGLTWSKESFIVYQNFEDSTEYADKWRNQSTTCASLQFATDNDDRNNHVIKYTVKELTGATATFDFNNGDQQIFKTGKSYIVTYRYKSEVSFHAYYDGINGNWIHYDTWVNSTDKWTTKTVEITPTDELSSFQIGFQLTGNGTIYLDDFRIFEKLDTIHTAFDNVGTDNTWYFLSDDIVNLTGEFYSTSILVDGRERKVVLQKSGSQIIIWPDFFMAIESGDCPVEIFQIKKDTVLTQVKKLQWAIPEEDGQRIQFANDLSVIKTERGWCLSNDIVSQDFESEEEYTGKWRNQSSYGSIDYLKDTVDTQNYVLKYTVSNLPSDTPATFDFNNAGTQVFEKDHIYIVKFRYQSDVPFHVYYANIDSGWNNYATWVSQTEEWKTMTIEFQPNDSLTNAFQIGFQLTGNGTFYLDDFTINELDESCVNNKTGKPVYFNIGSNQPYLIAAKTGTYTIKKNGTVLTEIAKNKDDKYILNVAGEYILTKLLNGITHIQKIVLYKSGDANADNEVNAKDLIAIKKQAVKNGNYNLAGMKAADVNTSSTVDDFDAYALRYNIARNCVEEAKADTALNGVMPIIGYDGPYENANKNHLTDDVFEMIADLGINTVVANRNQVGTDFAKASKMLELGEKYGLKMYLNNGYVVDPDNEDGVGKGKQNLEDITAQYDTYSSFAGYYIYDEPLYDKASYDEDGKKIKNYLTGYATLLPKLSGYANLSNYLNLFPYTSKDLESQITTSSDMTYAGYEKYVKMASDLGMDFLSYDLYLHDSTAKEFYTNLSWMRQIAQEEGKPFYAFVQVGSDYGDNKNYRTKQSKLTTVQEMYLEANAALAMGARGLSYYSLVQPEEYGEWEEPDEDGNVTDYYRSGLINAEGKANHGENNNTNYDYYTAAKRINTYIAKVDEVLMHATSTGVMTTDTNSLFSKEHIQSYIGDAYTDVGKPAAGIVNKISKNSGGSDIIVGCFDYYGKKAYMIVNTSTTKNTTPKLTFNGTYSYKYIDMDGDWKTGSGASFSYSDLKPGESVLVVVGE